jgi:hypothetical protein
MSRDYAVKDRDGTIHDEPGRKEALRSRKAYGGLIVQRKGEGNWEPWKRRRVFLWVFLAIQAVFIVWLIVGAATIQTGPSHAELASACYNHAWWPLFTSQADCVTHYGNALNTAGQVGKGIGAALVVLIWVVVDFFVALTYLIYRLARRA